MRLNSSGKYTAVNGKWCCGYFKNMQNTNYFFKPVNVIDKIWMVIVLKKSYKIQQLNDFRMIDVVFFQSALIWKIEWKKAF